METDVNNQNEEHRNDGQIFMSGILTDMENLLKQFDATNSVRFQDFAKLWVENNFSFIFWGLTKFYDKWEITEDILRIAMTFTQPPNSFQVMVGGLYLTYSLYLKQLMEPKVCIRVTMSQWRSLQDLLCLAIQQNHHDFIYIFRWLQFSHAFNFVAFSKQHVCPWNLQNRKVDSPNTNCEESNTEPKAQALEYYIDDGRMEMLSTIHKNYEDMKKQLKEKNIIDKKSAISLNTVPKDVGSVVTRQIRHFLSKRNGKHSSSCADGNASDESATSNNDDSIAASRKRIKEKQYASAVQPVQCFHSRMDDV